MASKKLKRLGYSHDILHRMQKHNINTCRDLISRSELELMNLLGVGIISVREILKKACKASSPAPVTLLESYTNTDSPEKKNPMYLATSLNQVDRVLHGGLPKGTISEIAGPAGCGKTQMSIMLSVIATLPTEMGGLGGAVIYIDTESAFSAQRLMEMAGARYPEHFSSDESLLELGTKVHVYLESTCESLFKRLENLEEDIISKQVKLIVIDSIASLIRKEFDSHSGRNLMERTQLLSKEASILKYLAESFSIPIVVTNQITTRYGPDKGLTDAGPDPEKEPDAPAEDDQGYVTAALGNTWSHSVNTRLIIQYLDTPRRQVMNKFREWLQQVNEKRDVLDIPALKLNKLIGLFLVQLTKEDGSDMEPDTITSYHRGIDRYLKENKYPERILTSDLFESSRVMLGAKRKELKGKGLGNRPNRAEALTDTMIEKLWETGELGDENGRSLQNSVFFYLTQGFGFRGCDESRQMEWGDITIKTSDKGEEYLEFKERLTKTRQGGSISGCRAYAPKIFAVGGPRCPIHYYKMFASHRPEKMLSPDSPFYLGVKSKIKGTDNVWYTSQPMGKNTISKIVPSMAKAAGIEGKIVNHSLRKQTCQSLLSNYVPDTMICELTGHKNVGSLRNYTTANLSQQKAMSDILCHSLANEKRKIAEIAGPQPNKMICMPSTSSESPGNVVACAPEKKGENALEKLIKASSGILSGATIHGNINLNINYHVSSSQSMNLSPKNQPAIE